ncbi:hypothetical protein ASG72_17545 [Bosea sp. Leaf344]|uniref:hypothetical protein n=1 Tax=Bosea sp. Leaf344 TaxID=1736346 RepID=UPI0006F39C77|nr:hypothetical protein [Bosea sp. Leaf344]KQU50414.1 hypothetical protein ASG72_17545 [Bosea sp. Leaf344]
MRHEPAPSIQPDLAAVPARQLSQSLQAGARGARDALDNYPPAYSASPSPMEATLRARVAELHGALRLEVSKRLDRVAGEVLALRETVTEERYLAELRNIDSGIRAALAQKGGTLQRRVHEALKARRDYVYFNYANGLSGDPRVLPAGIALACLIATLLIGSLLNAVVFAQAGGSGLPGGVMSAVLVCAVNIGLGFLLGSWPARYCRHARGSHLVWALPLLAAMISLILMVNLAVGHLSALLPGAPATLAHHVAARMVETQWAVQDPASLALILIGCLVACVAASIGYRAFGSYPGQSRLHRRWQESSAAVEAERRRLDADLTPELERLRRSIDGYRDGCAVAVLKLQRSRAAAEALREQYQTRLAQLRTARDAVASEYREANFAVRTDLPPPYFGRRLSIPGIDEPEALSAHRNVMQLIDEVEEQLQQMPALIEAKLREQLALLNGLDLIGEIERMKLKAMEAGRAAFMQEEADRRGAERGI